MDKEKSDKSSSSSESDQNENQDAFLDAKVDQQEKEKDTKVTETFPKSKSINDLTILEPSTLRPQSPPDKKSKSTTQFPYSEQVIPPLTRSSKKSTSSSLSSSSDNSIHFTAKTHISSDREIVEQNPAQDDGKSSGFTRRQILTIITFIVVDFLSAVAISLQAPFYPAEAEKKGATASEYGFVFGVFELVVFIFSPIFGKYICVIGPKTVFNCGIFVTGTCCILFGVLDQIEDRLTFITFSFIVRIVEALGEAAFVTASFTIIALEFPNSVASTFASMETFYGLGLIVGPTLGGALFQLGGYTLPFAVLGGLLFLSAIFTALVLPRGDPGTFQDEKQKAEILKENRFGYCKLLVIPSVALSAFSIVASSISIGYLSATLEPHLRQFGLNPVVLGSIFIISGGTYAISAPIWGWLADKSFCEPKIISLIGTIIIILGISLVGPLPFIPLDTMLWLVCIGLMFHGIGVGSTLVSAFIQALKDSLKYGFNDDVNTYGLISGMWVSMFSLGAFIGPSISGVLFDIVGFRTGSLFVVGVQIIVALCFFIFIFMKCNSVSRKEENLPLLNEPSTSNGNGSKNMPSTSYGSVA